MEIRLGDGLQPRQPIKLEFDLAGAPDLVAQLSEPRRPLIAVDDANGESDLLLASWDPDAQVVTATTPHLSKFTLLVTDPASALREGIARVIAGNDSAEPECASGDSAMVGETEVTLTPAQPGIVPACINASSDAVAISFDSESEHYYSVTSEPEGSFTPLRPDSSTDLIAVAIQGARGNATLPPKGMGRLDLPASTVSGAIYLTIDPVALQFGTLLAAMGMYGLDGSATFDAFQDLSASYDCAGTAIDSASEPDKESLDEFVGGLGDVASCVAAAAGKVVDAEGKVAAHKIGVVASLLTTLPDQLKASLTGVFSPFTGIRRLVYTLEPKVAEQAAPESTRAEPAAEPDASPSRVIDRIDIDTWGYDRVGEHTYIAANNNTKKIVIYWKSFAGDEQIRGECTSSVTLVGAGRTLEEHESRCDSYNPGTTLRVKAPGTYTATVTVRQEGQSALSRQVIVTVLPFGS